MALSQQNRSSAVMQQRIEARDSLDDFPTPPWATRALLEYLNPHDLEDSTVWEPACNRGYMARPLKEVFRRVTATDIHDYHWDGQQSLKDFLIEWDVPPTIDAHGVDWIITNPPFRLAQAFAHRAFGLATKGVALFVRLAFLEGIQRHAELFEPCPPFSILQFTERVVVHKGRVVADGSTATAYAWVVWLHPYSAPWRTPGFQWIKPCRRRLERPDDYQPLTSDL